jgi:3-oxoacyl-[acyl-carrier-protein] synthase-3
MAIEIIATGRSVPPRKVSNDELAKELDTSDDWIRSHTGIGNRHIADAGTATSDLAAAAARAALERIAERDGTDQAAAAASIDLIVVATASPDYPGFPSVACLVQAAVGASAAAAFDLTAGCTGFVYALEAAAGMLAFGGRKRALVIGAEVLSRITDWTDRGSCVLFGDGAGAVALERTEAPAAGPGRRGLVRSFLGADGSGGDHLIIRRGGSRDPFKAGETVERPSVIAMNGRAVYNFAVRIVVETIERLLAAEGLQAGDLARIVPHQANARIVQAAAKRLGLAEDKFYMNIEEYANTSAASIPIALDELERAGALKRGDLILTVGFGAGLTYGGNLIVW